MNDAREVSASRAWDIVLRANTIYVFNLLFGHFSVSLAIVVALTPFQLSGHVYRNYSNLNWHHLIRGRHIAVDIIRNLFVVSYV